MDKVLDIKVGQEVLVVGIGNNARHSTPKYKGIITKIGRKWFYIETEGSRYVGEENKFSVQNGLCDGGQYLSEWRVYLTEEKYLEELEKPKLVNSLTTQLAKVDYKTLKQVDEILNG